MLSCCLKEPHTVPRVQAALGGGELAANVFYHPAHRTVWAGMEALYRQKSTFDLITLNQILSQSEELASVGGPAFVAGLLDDVPSLGMLNHYLDILIDKAVRRAIILRMTCLSEQAYDADISRQDLLTEAEQVLFSLRELGTDKADRDGPRLLKTVLGEEVMPSIQHAYANRGKVNRGLSTGFIELDRMTLGLEGGKTYVIAARPSMGKTAFAMNIVQHVAAEEKAPVLFVSLEMSASELASRVLTTAADTDVYRLRDGFLSQIILAKIASAADDLSRQPIYIDDPSDLKIHELRSRCRRAVTQYGIRLIVIDYLPLLKSGSKQAASNRVNEIGDISRGIKAMAKELNIPIIVLCQLNRQADDRKHGIPRLADLRESGDIEQDADLVGLLYRPTRNCKDPAEAQRIAHMAFLDIAKQRSGPVGGGAAYIDEHEDWDIGCPGIPLEFVATRVCFRNPPGVQMYG